jgi:hypothetical protein
MHTHTSIVVPPDELRNLGNLLKKVQTFWIDGVLDNSVHHAVLLTLGKQTAPEAVEHPWERVQELPNGERRVLSPEVEIREIFDEANASLLILGDPGSGKTTTLLELTRDLLRVAQADPLQPVPVVLNLSTWAAKRQELDQWIITELMLRYQVPHWLGAQWVKNQRLLPLLDGLDEVRSELRPQCIEAIQYFVEKCGVPGLVVTCRTAEYQVLRIRMKMGAAIRLLPLGEPQIATYLAAAGPALSGVATVLAEDEELRILAQTPLMLSIISLAFYDAAPSEIASASEGLVARRHQLFGRYVDRMFEQRKSIIADEGATRQRLEWLAYNLQERSETVFRIEGLQPTWLWKLRQLWAYAVIPGAAARLILYTGVIMTTGVAFYREIGEAIVPVAEGGAFASVLVVLAFLTIGAVFDILRLERQFVSYSPDKPVSPLAVLVNVVTLGLIGDLKGRRPHLSQDIRTVEVLRWSSPRALRAGRRIFRKYAIFAAVLLILSLVVLLLTRNTDSAVVPFGLAVGITILGLLVGAIAALTHGMDGGVVETKVHPNQGIVLTARNAAVGGLIMTVLTAAAIAVLLLYGGVDVITASVVAFSLAPALGLSCSLCLGGFEVLQHYTLRWILSSSRRVPFRCHGFLEQSVKLLFMQRVGGGYIFIHRMLMDYFATQPSRNASQTVVR